MLPYIAEKDFATVIRLRIFRPGEYPGLSRWVLNIITCTLIKGRQRILRPRPKRIRQRNHRGRNWHDVATSQGMSAATRNWKGQGANSYQKPPEGA